MSYNPMISGTTKAGDISDSQQLRGRKVPQRKSIAAGSREQSNQLDGGVKATFSSTTKSIKSEAPNVTPGLRRTK